jgi:hypothetical protein
VSNGGTGAPLFATVSASSTMGCPPQRRSRSSLGAFMTMTSVSQTTLLSRKPGFGDHCVRTSPFSADPAGDGAYLVPFEVPCEELHGRDIGAAPCPRAGRKSPTQSLPVG